VFNFVQTVNFKKESGTNKDISEHILPDNTASHIIAHYHTEVYDSSHNTQNNK